MFGLGMGELVVILIVALIFLGPKKLPEAAKAIGKGIRELRKHTTDFQQTIEQDEELGGTVKEIKSALRGDPEPAPKIAPPKQPPKPAGPGDARSASGPGSRPEASKGPQAPEDPAKSGSDTGNG